MISPKIRRPHSLWRQHARWTAATGLFAATSEALALLWSARRLAFAPPEGTNWLAPCTHLLDVAAESLASPLPPESECAATVINPGANQLAGASPESAIVADHTNLVESIRNLTRNAHRSGDDAAAAILLGEQIGDLQLQLARHKTRLRDALGGTGAMPATAALTSRCARP